MLKRRQFLGKALTGLGAAATGQFLVNDVSAEETSPSMCRNPFSTDPVAIRQLTDQIKTSRIGLGTGMRGYNRVSNLTRMDQDKALDLVRFCYDSGIRYFDMADMYGTHGLCAQALAGKPRDSYTLGTKIWCHPGGVPEEERPLAEVLIERFLKELNTDYIDLIQIHCISNDQWDSHFADQMASLERLKEKGLIRAHGLSCHALSAIRKASEHPWVDVMHTRLNSANVHMEGTWDENIEALQTAHQNGKGVIAMKLIGEGSIQDPVERKKSVDAVTRLDCQDVMIVGFENRDQVTEFLNHVSDTLQQMEKEMAASAK